MPPKLIKGNVCAITFESCTDPGSPAETIIGTWTGEIDTWGKHTVERLDALAPGPYYLFPREILAVVKLSKAEIDGEVEAIRQDRLGKGLELLKQAGELIDAADMGAEYRRASEVANAGRAVWQAIAKVQPLVNG